MLTLRPKQTASLITRDGVRLDADIYQPEGDGPYPVLLMRQPYGREIASTVVYAHPQWYAAHGYIVVIQDVRGRGTSQGEFHLFTHELEDGLDTINWAAQLPGSTGELGMYGFSYQGMTQLYAASGKPKALKTICPAMIAYDLYADWAYEGGAFCLAGNLSWALQLAAETARLKNDAIAHQILYSASRNLPIHGREPRLDETLRKYCPDAFYYRWLEHAEPDDYWQDLSPKLDAVDLPMLHIGGWFDPYLRGTLRWYHELAGRSSYPQHLIVGPWAHLPWGRKVGELDYGAAAASPVDLIQVNWFNQFLKGQDTGRLDMPPISVFEMGSNRWRSLSKWPKHPHKSFYLSSTGLANMSDKEGFLIENPPPNPSVDRWVHDPWRPFPALGGHVYSPFGACDRSLLECRTDTVTYTSEPLTETLCILGEAIVEVYVQASTHSFDLCAILSQVQPDGRVYNFTQGYLCVTEPQSYQQIRLQSTCIQLPIGSSLRLSLSGACFPAYPVNPGTGQNPGQTRLIDAQIISFSLQSGGASPSRLLLPLESSF